ncbi:hypothetical protein [Fibrobacter sp.]|uniref:hypothetical protein n=1 Tax=Fibrobacter sp. TaxID=35828 RepID=UPI003864CD45
MDNIIVITQNVVLESLSALRSLLVGKETLIVSTQFVFENETEIIDKALGIKCNYINFAKLLSDAERQKCDEEAFVPPPHNLGAYYAKIKELKNERIIKNLLAQYPCSNRILVCDDLGIEDSIWLQNGFVKSECRYYHVADCCPCPKSRLNRVFGIIRSQLNFVKGIFKSDIWKSKSNGIKYLFFGSLNRIGYRIDLRWMKTSKLENLKYVAEFYSIRLFNFMPKNKTIRMTSLHEDSHWNLPDHPNFNTKKIQDGYLPPNYPSKYLYYFGPGTEFYTWDVMGQNTFKYHELKSCVMPVRKKLYLPEAKYPSKVKKVLCVASGAGDWTAIKNRSDEDMMMWLFGKVAAMFPDIEFVYRCHPVWVHPQHQGVNSINRAATYFDYLNLPNLKLSGNMPNTMQNGQFVLSYKRSSFEDDLKDVDVVFGEHSVSMIDAGFKGIIFCSCNVTGHRNYFEDMTKLGFPHCESIDEISNLLKSVNTQAFKDKYEQAIKNYNEMTDKEE